MRFDLNPNQRFIAFYNSSWGTAYGLGEAGLQMLNHRVGAVPSFVKKLGSSIDSGYLHLRLGAHSQGAIIMDRGLAELERSEGLFVEAATFGGARLIADQAADRVVNYVCENDVVSKIALWDAQRRKKRDPSLTFTVVRVPALHKIPGLDHASSDTYKDYVFDFFEGGIEYE